MPTSPQTPPQGKYEQLIHGQTVQRDKEAQRELDLGMPPVEPARPVDPKIEEQILKDLEKLAYILVQDGWTKQTFMANVDSLAVLISEAEDALFKAGLLPKDEDKE